MDRLSIFLRDTVIAAAVIGALFAIRNFIWGKKIPPKIEKARWLIAILVGVILLTLSFLFFGFEQPGYSTTVIAFAIYIIGSLVLKNINPQKEIENKRDDLKIEKEVKINIKRSSQEEKKPEERKKYNSILHKKLHPAVFIILFGSILIAGLYFGFIKPTNDRSDKIGKGLGLSWDNSREESNTSASEEKPPVEKPWEEFTSTKYGFKILFPSKPKEQDGLILSDSITEHKNYSTIIGDEIYQLSVLKYSSDTDVSSPDFESAISRTLSLGGAELVFTRETTVGGYKAMDYLGKNFTTSSGKFYVRAKLISVGRIQYTLAVFYKTESQGSDREKFIGSFELLK